MMHYFEVAVALTNNSFSLSSPPEVFISFADLENLSCNVPGLTTDKGFKPSCFLGKMYDVGQCH